MSDIESEIDRSNLAVRVFGPFRLESPHSELALRGRKTRGLLAYLVLAPGKRATRECLAEILWTDRGPDQSRASLRQAIAELRAIPELSSVLAIDRNEIALDAARVSSDIDQVLAAATGGTLENLARRLEGMSGALLENLPDISPAFDEWLAIERPNRVECVLQAVLARLQDVGPDDVTDARAILRSLDRIDPCNEAVARLGMRLDHAAADNAALHRRYRRLSDQLRNEFGALPSDTTQSLFRELSSGAPERAPISAGPQQSMSGAISDLLPLVIVAPLQVSGACALSGARGAYCVDAIRVALSGMAGLKVLAVEAAELDEIARASTDSLALYLLSGKAFAGEGQVMVTLQLSNVGDRTLVWSETMALVDGSQAAEEIVAKAVGAAKPAIDRHLDRLLRAATGEMASDRATFTRARLMIRNASNLAETQAGAALLERVIERDPRHLGARLLLVRMYNTDFWQQMAGHDVRSFRERARKHMDYVAAVEPSRADVRVRRAWCFLREGAHAVASKEFAEVLSCEHLDPDIVDECAFGLCHLGELEAARRSMQRAFRLNPFPPSDYHADYAAILALSGEHTSAEDHFLVSGETGLQYDAIRIANFARCSGGTGARDKVAERFTEGFRRAWQGASPPGLDEVVEWIDETLPLSTPEHLEFVRSGLQEILAPTWPGGARSSS